MRIFYIIECVLLLSQALEALVITDILDCQIQSGMRIVFYSNLKYICNDNEHILMFCLSQYSNVYTKNFQITRDICGAITRYSNNSILYDYIYFKSQKISLAVHYVHCSFSISGPYLILISPLWNEVHATLHVMKVLSNSARRKLYYS